MRIPLLIFITLIAWGRAALAEEAKQEAFPIPDRYNLVNDYQGILTYTETERLHGKMRALEAKNGTQIVLLIVPSIGDMSTIDYANQVFEKWDIGHNGDGNGVLFLINAQNGSYRFTTGPGIAGALPDAKLRQLWEKHMDPHWQKQEWVAGIEEIIEAMIAVSMGEETKAGHPATFIEIKHDHLIAIALALVAILYVTGVWLVRRRKKRAEGACDT